MEVKRLSEQAGMFLKLNEEYAMLNAKTNLVYRSDLSLF